jgi:hypothetical protein
MSISISISISISTSTSASMQPYIMGDIMGPAPDLDLDRMPVSRPALARLYAFLPSTSYLSTFSFFSSSYTVTS